MKQLIKKLKTRLQYSIKPYKKWLSVYIAQKSPIYNPKFFLISDYIALQSGLKYKTDGNLLDEYAKEFCNFLNKVTENKAEGYKWKFYELYLNEDKVYMKFKYTNKNKMFGYYYFEDKTPKIPGTAKISKKKSFNRYVYEIEDETIVIYEKPNLKLFWLQSCGILDALDYLNFLILNF